MIKWLLISVWSISFLVFVLLLWCVARIATRAAELETKLWEAASFVETLERECEREEREDEDGKIL